MNEKFHNYVPHLKLKAGAFLEALAYVETQINAKLPDDYKEFMCFSNGATGFVGESYLILFNIEDMLKINLANEYLPILIIFGSDGGGNSYVFSTTETMFYVGEVSSISIGIEKLKFCAHTFTDFLKYMRNKKFDE